VHPVISALGPVLAVIVTGWFIGRRGWVGAAGVKRLSSFVFLVLSPPLLFRTMGRVRLEQLDLRPLAAYFIGVAVIFFGMLALQGLNRRAAVLALTATFSNTVMIGVPLVGLAFGESGLVTLFTLVSVHALTLLTTATIVLELTMVREAQAEGGAPPRHPLHTVLLAVRNSVIHPVTLPILAGLAFAQTGWVLPPWIDGPLRWIGIVFGPVALVLVGIALAGTRIGQQWRGALALAAAKNLLHPALVLAAGWAMGLQGAGLAVMVLAASLPIGANVFLFSQRYKVAQELVTAAVAASTLGALLSTTLVLLVFAPH
jgi:predicted permease